MAGVTGLLSFRGRSGSRLRNRCAEAKLKMLLGEQAGGWVLAKKIEATNVASVPVVAEGKDPQQLPKAQS